MEQPGPVVADGAAEAVHASSSVVFRAEGAQTGDGAQEEEEAPGAPGGRAAARARPRTSRGRRQNSCLNNDFAKHRIPVELTPFGARTRTIVFTSLGGGTTCGGTRDWRANLPRYMGMFTGATVIRYHARDNKCDTCWSPNRRPVRTAPLPARLVV